MKQNNWEVWHDTDWTEFELHSAVFGHLRKHLYPKYLVRGNYNFITESGIRIIPDISIFEKTKGRPAILKVIVEIKRPDSTFNKETLKLQYGKYKYLNVPVIYVEGRTNFMLILEHLKDLGISPA